MADFFWSVVPPLTLLGYYHRRITGKFASWRTCGFFCAGLLVGMVALAVGWQIETNLLRWSYWQNLMSTFGGAVIRQLLVVAPIEELGKFIGFAIPIYFLQQRRLSGSMIAAGIFLLAVALSLGFTCHESWVFLRHGNSSIFERLISTPVHAMFVVPWVYVVATIGFRVNKSRIVLAWGDCVLCHAGVNICAIASGFNVPVRYLGYCLFPFLLYLFWRMERYLKLVEGRKVKYLLKYFPPSHRYWRFGLIVFALALGGNACLGLFITIQTILPLPINRIWEYSTLTLLIGRILYNIAFGLVGWVIYIYLLTTARHR